MANKKISQLTAIVTVDTAADLFPIVDTSAIETKSITPSALKTALSLGNVDNTTDANKPISSLTQTALNAKQATLVSATNIKTINSTSVLGSGNIVVGATPSGIAGAIQFSDGSAFASDATNLFYDDTNNRLGIGTSTPTDGLTIKANSTQFAIQMSNDSTGYNEFAFRNAAGTVIAEILSTVTISTYGTQNGGLGFFTNGIGAIPQMLIASAGNVGIGTSSPTARLQVKGSGATSATTSLLVQNSGGTELFKVRDDGRTNVSTTLQIDAQDTLDRGNGLRYNYVSGSHILRFYTNSGTERLTILNDGSVGIGETAPTARLQVKGSGATSATTSLLVQDSAGTELLRVRDDNIVTMFEVSATYVRSSSFTQATFLYINGTNTRINSPSTGVLTLTDVNTTDFNRLQFGGTTSSFPAIKRNAAAIDIRLADDSNYAALNTGATLIKGSGATSATTSLLVQNSAGSTALQIKDDLTINVVGILGSGSIQNIMSTNNNLSFGAGYYYRLFATADSNSVILGSNYDGSNTYTYAERRFVVGSSSINASAALQADSTTKGFLPPRMTTTQRNAISSPAEGLMIYNTTTAKLNVYTTAWEAITSV